MSEKKDPWVTIHILSEDRARKFSPERRATAPEAYQQVLKMARDTRYTAVCNCERDKELRLYVRTDPRSGQFSLRRFPFTGPSHAETCSYYCRVNRDGGASTYSADAIREDADGTLHLSLSYSLRVNPGDSAQAHPEPCLVPRQRHATRKQPNTTLLGMLHLLWETTETNCWTPAFEGRRSQQGVMWRIREAAGTIKQGRTLLRDVLILPGRSQDNSNGFRYAAQNSRRLVVISELDEWSHTLEDLNGILPVTCPTDSKKLYLNIDATRWKDTLERFRQESAWWRQGGKVIAIAVTDVPVEGSYWRAQVRQVCLMMVSPRYIPLDSSYEGTVEEKLARERRSFVKPLRYDAAEDEYHPDFCLTDVESTDIYPMEVWGMETADYQLHRLQKTAWYNQEYQQYWWGWNVATQDVPNLPVKNKSYQDKYPVEEEKL
ncbi:DUF1173 family protein [Pectobacterium brasiliense]|uniref:DUF1173 family protein n=1 Tax=Pectobacterium brasiliense TaxID=180957 RepID=UPI0019694264|nr:DUF1173 family protein [Pectobacterium brasiliense]MBN3263022.1 DUF1173 family protein [Pectobacterium brasiliense]